MCTANILTINIKALLPNEPVSVVRIVLACHTICVDCKYTHNSARHTSLVLVLLTSSAGKYTAKTIIKLNKSKKATCKILILYFNEVQIQCILTHIGPFQE